MSSISITADTIAEALCAVVALFCLLFGLHFAMRRQFLLAALLLVPAGLAIAFFVFLLTFRISI
jgi:uncharacterized membrane protein YhfC